MLLEGIELSTSPLPRECSTTELQQLAGGRRGIASGVRRVQAWGMSKDEPPPPPGRPKPALTPAAEAAKRAREERLAAALRENLRKRKSQARAREDGEKD